MLWDVHLLDAQGFEIYLASLQASLKDISLVALDDVHYYARYYDDAEEHSEDDYEEDPERRNICAATKVKMGEEAGVIPRIKLLG